jgi:hypothetical protein
MGSKDKAWMVHSSVSLGWSLGGIRHKFREIVCILILGWGFPLLAPPEFHLVDSGMFVIPLPPSGDGLTASYLRKAVPPVVMEHVQGQGFLDLDHWLLALQGRLPDGTERRPEVRPEWAYGKEALEAWKKAASFVMKEATGRMPTPEDFLKVHRIVYGFEGATYTAFWLAQIARHPDRNARNHLYSLLRRRNFDELKLQMRATEPLGTWRSGPIYTNGYARTSVSPKDGFQATFSNAEKEALHNNSALRVRREREVELGRWWVEFEYLGPLPNDTIEDRVREDFARMEQGLKALGPLEGFAEDDAKLHKVDLVLAEFHKRLVSDHPTWDGSGRTTRLLRDWVYRHHQLPLPNHTPYDDLTLSVPELAEAFDRNRSDWANFEVTLDDVPGAVGEPELKLDGPIPHFVRCKIDQLPGNESRGRKKP